MAKLDVKKKVLEAQVPNIRLRKSTLGEGGNARVFPGKCKDDGRDVAVKFLLNADPKRYQRFRDEVLVVTSRLVGSPAVLPILEHDLSSPPSAEFIPYYVMPRAVGLWDKTNTMGWRDRLEALIHIADALVEIHSKGVAHRDIKPENLFFWEGQYRFGDFGIAHFPEKSGVTTESEPMGPAGYMAPEMESATKDKDALKADVFSMAKTVWTGLTKQKYPFVGQYVSGRWTSVETLIGDKNFVHESLEDLLHRATDIDPGRRPTADEFAEDLRRVAEAQGNFVIANTLQWRAAELEALGQFGTARAEWHGVSEIASVMSYFSRRRGLNHLFFPHGGGLTVSKISLCEGGKMLALHFSESGEIDIVKPMRLTLERFGNDPRFSYAVLETSAADKLDVAETYDGRQLLRRLNDYDYAPVRTADYNEEFGVQPGQPCSRYFEPGVFVISPTTGVFNKIDDYMGTGQKLGRDGLRSQWQKLVDRVTASSQPEWLTKETRLLRRADYADASLNLQYLDENLLKALIGIDDLLHAQNRAESKERGGLGISFDDLYEAMLAPPTAEESQAEALISSLSKEALAEYFALICVGRGTASPNKFASLVEDFKDFKNEISYYCDLLGSGHLRRALAKFGYKITLE